MTVNIDPVLFRTLFWTAKAPRLTATLESRDDLLDLPLLWVTWKSESSVNSLALNHITWFSSVNVVCS